MTREERYMRLIQDIAASTDSFRRIPEPASITEAVASVDQYNKVMNTNITVNYSLSLDLIHRARGAKTDLALDLCSGPGHLSINLKDQLGFRSVTGVDFSVPMVQTARANADHHATPGQLAFRQQNVIKLNETKKYDLVSFTNAAHHFGSIEDIATVLSRAEACCDENGIVVVTDLARLPTRALTDEFVELGGEDYIRQNMQAMYEDFHASMLAAFSPDEFRNAVPKSTNRDWYQVVCAALPFFQALIAVPIGRKDLFVRGSRDWKASGMLRSDAAKADWDTLSGLLYAGLIRKVEPVTERKKAA